MARALVTGATGFIGKHLVKALVDRGNEVTVFVRDKKSLDKTDLDKSRLYIFEGDISNYDDVLSVFELVKPHLVFNLSAVLSRGVDVAEIKELKLVNEIGSNNIVNAISETRNNSPVESCVLFGTSMEYGIEPTNLVEDGPCIPVGKYAIHKHEATIYATKKAKDENLPIVSARIFTPYGPGMNENSLVYKVCRAALLGEDINLSDPDVTRDFVYIDDVIKFILKLSDKAKDQNGEVFNVGTGVSTSLQDLVNLITSLTNSQSMVFWNKNLVSELDNRLWKADMSKTHHIIGWHHKTTLREGLERTLDDIGNIV